MSMEMELRPAIADRQEPLRLDSFADDTGSFPSDDNAQLLHASADNSLSTNADAKNRSRGVRGLRTFRVTEGSTSMEPDSRCTFVSDEADVTTTRTSTTSTAATGKLKSCCTRLVTLVRSIGGLIVLLLAYTLIGAWIMMELESPTERQNIAEVVSNRGDTVELMKNITWNLQAGAINDSQWEDQVRRALHSFEENVFKSGVTSTTNHKWTYFGSVLFCVTT